MRGFLKWFVSAVLFGIALAIAAEFFIELARENGWYSNPSAKVGWAMSALSSLVANTWFMVSAGVVFGLTAGLWVDSVLRRFEKEPSVDRTGQLLNQLLEQLMNDLQILYAHQWSPEQRLFEDRLESAQMRILQSLPTFNERSDIQASLRLVASPDHFKNDLAPNEHSGSKLQPIYQRKIDEVMRMLRQLQAGIKPAERAWRKHPANN
jgi:hypothetical protein